MTLYFLTWLLIKCVQEGDFLCGKFVPKHIIRLHLEKNPIATIIKFVTATFTFLVLLKKILQDLDPPLSLSGRYVVGIKATTCACHVYLMVVLDINKGHMYLDNILRLKGRAVSTLGHTKRKINHNY